MTFAKEKFSKLQPAGIELGTFCLQGRHANPHAMNVLNGGKNNLGHHTKKLLLKVFKKFSQASTLVMCIRVETRLKSEKVNS